MTLTATDWTVTKSSGNIRYTGDDHDGTLPSYATVLEMRRWLQGLADDPEYVVASSDEVDITQLDPAKRLTDNYIRLKGIYNLDDASVEHLFDGSIIQGTGGIVNYGNAGVVIQLQQNSAIVSDDWWNWGVGGTDDTSAGADFMTDSTQSWVTDEWVGYVIKNTTDSSQALITANTGTTIVGILYGGSANTWTSADAYLISSGLNPDSTQGISHRFLVKVRAAGADIDGRRLIGINRTFGKAWAELKIAGTSRGNNTLALKDAADINNTTAIATIAAYTDVFIDRVDSTTTVDGVNAAAQPVLNVASGAVFADGDFIMTGVASDASEYQIASISVNALTLNRNLEVATVGGETVYDLNIGWRQIDVDNDTTDEDYFSEFDKGAKTINQFTEYMKFLGAENSVGYIYGLPGEMFRGITHQLDVDGPTGTFASVEAISWSGGTGQLLAIDSPTAGTLIWYQLLTGAVPADNDTITGGISGGTVAADLTTGSSIERPISTPFYGASTGSALIGAYGFGLQKADLSKNDRVVELTGTTVTPPNNVTNTVQTLVSGEDYVFIAPWDGSTTDSEGKPVIQTTNMSNTNLLSGAAEGFIEVDEAIPNWVPDSGTLRVVTNAGRHQLCVYTSVDRSTRDFTISPTEDFSGDNASIGNDIYVTPIDVLATGATETWNAVHTVDDDFVLVVRDGGGTPIEEYKVGITWEENSQTFNIIRQSDE